MKGITVQTILSDENVKKMNEKRGLVPASAWIRSLIEKELEKHDE